MGGDSNAEQTGVPQCCQGRGTGSDKESDSYAEQTGVPQCYQGRGIGPDKESDWVVTHMQNRQGPYSVVKGEGQAKAIRLTGW